MGRIFYLIFMNVLGNLMSMLVILRTKHVGASGRPAVSEIGVDASEQLGTVVKASRHRNFLLKGNKFHTLKQSLFLIFL